MLILVENCPVVLKKILNFINVFLLFCNHLLLKKGVTLYFNKSEFPFTKGCFVLSFLEIALVGLEKKTKM